MHLAELSAKRYYALFASLFLVFGILVASATSTINYQLQFTDVIEEIRAQAKSTRDQKQHTLRQFVRRIEDMTHALADNPILRAFAASQAEADRDTLNSLLLTIAASESDIMQARYLDADGLERARVNRKSNQGAPIVVPADKLQNKRDRYYFQETARLPAGELWRSNIDLNVENGKIEVPIAPTLRIATPVWADNQFAGIVIINMHASRLLDALTGSRFFHIYLIDKNGEFLTHTDPEKSWSHYLPSRPKLTSEFPEIAQRALANQEVIEPEFALFSLAQQLPNHDETRLLLIPRKELVDRLQEANLHSAAIIGLIVLLISIPLSWMVALIPARMKKKLDQASQEIYAYHRIVDRNVYTSTTDESGRIISVSSAFCDVSGYAAGELIGSTQALIRHPDTPGALYEEMWSALQQGKTWQGEIQNIKKNGEAFWQQVSITPQFDSRGQISSYTAVGSDITDKKAIERISITDQLTGLFNRRHLDAALSRDYDLFLRYNHPFSVIILDVDKFKRVNDEFGHQAGDGVLVKMAEVLRAGIRTVDAVGRWGGEEFLVICPNTTLEQAGKAAEKLRAAVEAAEFPVVGHVTASFGVSQVRASGDVDDLIQRADSGLYQAKEQGRNRVVLVQAAAPKN
ncbi:sensor domain-containing diguanylate cyclase [Magnetofaba australis]|uniref:Putative PAS/PAC sensor-containing diguanylate cyclase n=1 Tax=Magnetofaba australis IT-1 TaxID=1434232 RepID=A0A1Y2K4Y8_9PROT|nr:diguanylate cyclase [Magnetofaba australis]OSM04440.1 putative PAS/PAC sensor-containing diguanylate cyclase [Magnetofaba australis IT-1]